MRYNAFMVVRLTKKEQILAGGFIILLVAALVPGVYYYQKYRQTQLKLVNPAAYAKEQALTTITQVAKLMLLPTDEDPTVVEVKDVSKLTDQSFYAKAKNGDIVLIYTKARFAVLYNPSSNKIINVAPITIGTGTPTATASAAPRFVLYNGTDIVGLTKKYQTTLMSAVPNAEITDTNTASKRDYSKTLLIDIAGTHTSEAAQLANGLGVSVGPLPSGEAAPSGADFLIIVGADQK